MSEARKAVTNLDAAVSSAHSFRERSTKLLEEAHRALGRLEQVRSGAERGAAGQRGHLEGLGGLRATGLGTLDVWARRQLGYGVGPGWYNGFLHDLGVREHQQGRAGA